MTLGGRAVTRRDHEGAGKVLFIALSTGYQVCSPCGDALNGTHQMCIFFCIYVMLHSGSALRFEIALFLLYDACNLNTKIWKSDCAFVSPFFLPSPSLSIPRPCRSTRTHVHTHTCMQPNRSLSQAL